MMQRRWVNHSQPQTLYIATFLLYMDAAFAVLFSGGAALFNPISLLIVGGSVAAGYGLANEFKWGYGLALALAIFGLLPYVLFLLDGGNVILGGGISLVFAVAKLALLVHPQSREYQKIWFK